VPHRRQLARRCHLTAAGPAETGATDGVCYGRAHAMDGPDRSAGQGQQACGFLENSFLPHEPSSFSVQQGKRRNRREETPHVSWRSGGHPRARG
jgi:hypothetical protein